MNVLVTGGTGYIGSHVCHLLRDRGDKVVIVDDVVNGIRERVSDFPVTQLDLADTSSVDIVAQLLIDNDVDSVVHFAARKQVGESVAKPAMYYRDNLGGMANLILAMEKAGADKLVYSSSASVYGEPAENPVFETTPLAPINPYGETKVYGEHLLKGAERAGVLRGISLRYFNVAGSARPELSDIQALNLIPMVIERLVAGEAPRIFGDDYPTADGTCIRDYIHVVDLAQAHLAALDTLATGKEISGAYNIGTGRGSSVREVIDSIIAVSGKHIEPIVEARRPGDPAEVVADARLANDELGWSASYGLEDMTRSAWEGWLATH
ncbi:UDP-glucose 4-epimerase GalE [Arcanobacterium haemolyticum]|nr:UDP-glucose 4-epimerase GalE [Arcanobacterium haemolyticum]